jgi:hypothetical protein
MANRTRLRVGTDTDNVTQLNNPLRTLLFGFQMEFTYIKDFWTDKGNGILRTTDQNVS